MADFVDQLLGWVQRIAELDDPPVREVCAHYAVPPGRVFRYYDTRGRLVAYVNLKDIEALAKRVLKEPPPLEIADARVWGIPVLLEREPELCGG